MAVALPSASVTRPPQGRTKYRQPQFCRLSIAWVKTHPKNSLSVDTPTVNRRIFPGLRQLFIALISGLPSNQSLCIRSSSSSTIFYFRRAFPYMTNTIAKVFIKGNRSSLNFDLKRSCHDAPANDTAPVWPPC